MKMNSMRTSKLHNTLEMLIACIGYLHVCMYSYMTKGKCANGREIWLNQGVNNHWTRIWNGMVEWIMESNGKCT